MFQALKYIIFRTTNCKYHQMLTKGHFKEHTLDVTMQGLSALPSESEYTVHTYYFINLSVFHCVITKCHVQVNVSCNMIHLFYRFAWVTD